MQLDNVSQMYRMKSHCVVSGVTWWQEGGVYSGRAGTGEIGTVRLWAPDGADSLEVLRGSVECIGQFVPGP